MPIEPTGLQLKAFLEAEVGGPITMLNIVRFRDVADYSDAPDLAPDEPISGRAAYERYGVEVQPFLQRAGAEVTVAANSLPSVIGPEDESWDQVLLVRYPSRDAFIAMTTDPDYLAISRHRSAGLADSRLIPLVGLD